MIFPEVVEQILYIHKPTQGALESSAAYSIGPSWHFCFFITRIHFGQISSNQMLLSVIDELRTNTLSKVREIRVSSIWKKLFIFLTGPENIVLITLFTFPRLGRDGLQQRRPPVPPAGDREQRGRDVLHRRHRATWGEEEEEEEEGASHPHHRLNQNGHFWLFDRM